MGIIPNGLGTPPGQIMPDFYGYCAQVENGTVVGGMEIYDGVPGAPRREVRQEQNEPANAGDVADYLMEMDIGEDEVAEGGVPLNLNNVFANIEVEQVDGEPLPMAPDHALDQQGYRRV